MVKYLQICSAGRSGSTLLDLLLGSHSNIFSMGEIAHLTKNISLNSQCSCGVQVTKCRFWCSVINELNSRIKLDIYHNPYSFDLGYIRPVIIKDVFHDHAGYKFRRWLFAALSYYRLKYNLSFADCILSPLKRSHRNTFMLYDAVRKISGRQIVVDSTKEYQRATWLYKSAPEKTRIILLTRDGRGVLCSSLKKGAVRLKEAVANWQRYYKRAVPVLENNIDPTHIFQVKYEELTHNPQMVLQQICDFIGLTFEMSMLDFAQYPHHITNGNNMRFAKNSDIRADNAWQEKLSAADLDYFHHAAGNINKKLGYL